MFYRWSRSCIGNIFAPVKYIHDSTQTSHKCHNHNYQQFSTKNRENDFVLIPNFAQKWWWEVFGGAWLGRGLVSEAANWKQLSPSITRLTADLANNKSSTSISISPPTHSTIPTRMSSSAAACTKQHLMFIWWFNLRMRIQEILSNSDLWRPRWCSIIWGWHFNFSVNIFVQSVAKKVHLNYFNKMLYMT